LRNIKQFEIEFFLFDADCLLWYTNYQAALRKHPVWVIRFVGFGSRKCGDCPDARKWGLEDVEMETARYSSVLRTIPVLIAVCLVSLTAQAKYSGGTGDPNDPYQIATAEDLMLLGETPDDYDKHFIMTANIDLDPNLPGRKVFDRAVIAPDTNDVDPGFEGTAFAGAFDGNEHTISNLTVIASGYLGLFGKFGSEAKISDLGLEIVDIKGTGDCVGGLVGLNDRASITSCYCTGTISGDSYVGGLVGANGRGGYTFGGTVTQCYSNISVSGSGEYIGGLVGYNSDGTVTQCYSHGLVSGGSYVGGLVGFETRFSRCIMDSYSTATVTATMENAGGLVGCNVGTIVRCYSTGLVTAPSQAGGLVGAWGRYGSVTDCFWDIETSGQATSVGGTGKTTAEMQMANTFLPWGTCVPFWTIDDGRDYPQLAWENELGEIITGTTYSGGMGTADDPYLISRAEDLNVIGICTCHLDKYFELTADIDLSGHSYNQAVVPKFAGVFDGGGHTISYLTIVGESYLGLFGQLSSEASVMNLGVVDVNIAGSGEFVGSLVGYNSGTVIQCYSTGAIGGDSDVGGLVGCNDGNVIWCYSTGAVSGEGQVGGLVGTNSDNIANCFSIGAVSGTWNVGGLVGHNGGSITASYSTGTVTGVDRVGGLVGLGDSYRVSNSVWDMETSGRVASAGGTGLTMAEMQDIKNYLNAGWDFVDETVNGTEDIWKISEGLDYPRLWWEKYGGGTGEPNNPYLIYTAEHLNEMGAEPNDYDKHFKLMADIDLSGYTYDRAVIAPDVNDVWGSFQGISFTGAFDGNGHTVSHLTIDGSEYLGLFGRTGSGASISNLGLEAVDVNGTGRLVGGLMGLNHGGIASSFSAGSVSGDIAVGGLVGENVSGSITSSHSAASVSGTRLVGGLVGIANSDAGSIISSYNAGPVTGVEMVGGLTGVNEGRITSCYSTGMVTGISSVGGLVGLDESGGFITSSFWDTEISGQTTSDGGTGKTTAEMQSASSFLEAGWDFIDETANGTDDIWWILEGEDYPRLWWEANGN